MKAKRIAAIFLSGFSFLSLFGSSELWARSRDDRESSPDVGFKAGVEWGTDEGVKFHGTIHGIVEDERGNYLKREIRWESDGKATTSLSKGTPSIDGSTIKWKEEEITNLNEPQNAFSNKKEGGGYEKLPCFQKKTVESLDLASADVLIPSKVWNKDFVDIVFLAPILLPIETILSLKFLFSNYLVLRDYKFQDLHPFTIREKNLSS